MTTKNHPLAEAVLAACKRAVASGCSLDNIDLDAIALSVAKKEPASSIAVQYWGCYDETTRDLRRTHQIDVEDHRLTSGQLHAGIGSLEGHPDDFFGVTLEVGANPLTGVGFVPAIHVHFDGDAMAFSLFRVGDKILLRPETDVCLERDEHGNFQISQEVSHV